jgi:hypothetical protein
VAVQPRRDERPQLVEPDRRHDDHADPQRDLHLEDEQVGDAELHERALPVLGHHAVDGHPAAHQVAVGVLDRLQRPLGQEEPADDESRDNAQGRLEQPAAQLTQVLQQGHGAVGGPLELSLATPPDR